MKDLEEERIWRQRGCRYIESFLRRLGLTSDVNNPKNHIRASACFYFQLFYSHFSFCDEDIGLVALTCAWLASKTGEQFKRMKEVTKIYQ